MKSFLVMGLIQGYSWKKIAPFVKSLSPYMDDGVDVVLFYKDIPKKTLRKLEQYNVTLISFTETYPFVSYPIVAPAPNTQAYPMHICTRRFLMYYLYLAKINRLKYQQVMLTDVRDVVFQSDPSELIKGEDILAVFQEDQQVRESNHNVSWLTNLFGVAYLNTVQDRQIICAGTTVGSIQKVYQYLQTMLTTLTQVDASTGEDQGMHNYIVFENEIPGIRVFTNSDPMILTTAGRRGNYIIKNGMVCEPKSQKPYIVLHQYDRVPCLRRMFYRWDEQIYLLLRDIKIFWKNLRRHV